MDFIRHDYTLLAHPCRTRTNACSRTVKSWGRGGGEEKGGASRKRVISHLWICELPTDHEDGIVLSCFSIERKISRILLIENYIGGRKWGRGKFGIVWDKNVGD